MNTTTNTRGVSDVHRPLLQEARDQLHSLAGGFMRADQLIARIDAALSAEPAAQGEEVVDRVAKAIADAAGHGMREKCEHMAHAAIAAYQLATWNTAPPAQPAERVPSVCDGKEQDAFEAWARSQSYNMTVHPLHWLFLDKETFAARQGWKGALEYVASLTASPAPSEGGKGVGDAAARELYIASQCDAHNLHTLAWHELTEKQRDEWRKKATGAAR